MGDATTQLSQTYSAKHHESFNVGGGSIMPAKMAGHSDEEMAALKRLRR